MSAYFLVEVRVRIGLRVQEYLVQRLHHALGFDGLVEELGLADDRVEQVVFGLRRNLLVLQGLAHYFLDVFDDQLRALDLVLLAALRVYQDRRLLSLPVTQILAPVVHGRLGHVHTLPAQDFAHRNFWLGAQNFNFLVRSGGTESISLREHFFQPRHLLRNIFFVRGTEVTEELVDILLRETVVDTLKFLGCFFQLFGSSHVLIFLEQAL